MKKWGIIFLEKGIIFIKFRDISGLILPPEKQLSVTIEKSKDKAFWIINPSERRFFKDKVPVAVFPDLKNQYDHWCELLNNSIKGKQQLPRLHENDCTSFFFKHYVVKK